MIKRNSKGRFVKGHRKLTNKGDFKKGHAPHNKGKTKENYKPLKRASITVSDTRKRMFKEGKLKPNSSCFKKGNHPTTEFKKGDLRLIGNKYSKGIRPWNYIDGRSKFLGPARYGEDWDNIRLKIYKRDNYLCQKCKVTMNDYKRPLDIHHRIPFLLTYDNSHNNLITLCRRCHMQEERRISKIFNNIFGGVSLVL